jgi:hypothetical protein
MAEYKYPQVLAQNTAKEFDVLHNPGERTPYSGIYRCDSCGVEIVSEEGKPFPPTRACSGHHSWKQGVVRWHLAVFANHKGS